MGQLQCRALHAQPSGGLGLMSVGRGWKVPSGVLRMGRYCGESETRTREKCHMWMPGLIVTRASAYGSSHRQDTGQSFKIGLFYVLISPTDTHREHLGCFRRTYLLSILQQEMYLLESVSECWECSSMPHREFGTKRVLFNLPSTPLFLPGISWVLLCVYAPRHSHAVNLTHQGCPCTCIIFRVSLLEQALHLLDVLDLLELNRWALKLEWICSCAVNQVHPEHISTPGCIFMNQPNRQHAA